MPSSKAPNTVVNPGPGRLAAGQVPASALAFPFGGSGDLGAHINDPVDAHMSGAIGIPETHPVTGQALLSTAGGPYDGESVLDALTALSDLLPARPDRIGFNNPSVPNSGLTNWSTALTANALRGGFTKAAGTGITTKYLTPVGSLGNQTVSGVVYPADRGVLAIYQTTEGNFANAGQTTLVAALWLGTNPPPAGIPGANFVESTRPSGQSDYTPSNVGLDLITLIDRLPYLSSYPGAEYTPFNSNFSAFQLGKYSFPITLNAGDTGSFLLIHWKESYATQLSQIQPAALSGAIIASNCYSAVPADGSAYEEVNRLHVFVDAQSGAGPNTSALTTSPAGTVTTSPLSGVLYYNSVGLQINILGTIEDLFENSYLTNATASASVLAGFESTTDPVEVRLQAFNGSSVGYPLYDAAPARLLNNATGLAFTKNVAPPQTTSVARIEHATHPLTGVVAPIEPVFPHANVVVRWRGAFAAPVDVTSTEQYLFNVGFTGLSTATLEHFCSEEFRYLTTHLASNPSVPIPPSGGTVFNSATALAANDGILQVHSGRLVYPGTNFNAAAYRPAQAAGRDYATVRSGDAANHKRRYLRAFNTGIARNTGRLRITGLAFSAFDTGILPVDPAEITDHPGGAIVQIRVPGGTGWLDLGRANGLPDLTKTNDFTGCRTGTSGDIYSFDTGAFTTPNGSGAFVLFVRITFIKNGTGENLSVQEIEWLPP